MATDPQQKMNSALAYVQNATDGCARGAALECRRPMPAPLFLPGRTLILRHGETVFNAARRLQGDAMHTPLTRTGFAQMDAIGAGLRDALGERPALTVWTSDAGRTRQSWAVVAEHLDLDWFDARVDARLGEIGMGEWGGRSYAELTGAGETFDPATGWFTRAAPGGEWTDDIARRLSDWVAEAGEGPGDRLVVMHGLSSRVLRGLLTGDAAAPGHETPLATALPQGSVVAIEGGRETVLVRGGGGTHA